MHGNQRAQIFNCTVPEYDDGILYESEAANQGSLQMHTPYVPHRVCGLELEMPSNESPIHNRPAPVSELKIAG